MSEPKERKTLEERNQASDLERLRRYIRKHQVELNKHILGACLCQKNKKQKKEINVV